MSRGRDPEGTGVLVVKENSALCAIVLVSRELCGGIDFVLCVLYDILATLEAMEEHARGVYTSTRRIAIETEILGSTIFSASSISNTAHRMSLRNVAIHNVFYQCMSWYQWDLATESRQNGKYFALLLVPGLLSSMSDAI